MKLNKDQLEDEIDTACIKAVKGINDKIHNEIQKTLNKIHAVYPIEKILMGNGGYTIKGGTVHYYEDGEDCEFNLRDLSYEVDSMYKSYYWEYLDREIYDDVEYLFALLNFITDGKYTRIKDFTPN